MVVLEFFSLDTVVFLPQLHVVLSRGILLLFIEEKMLTINNGLRGLIPTFFLINLLNAHNKGDRIVDVGTTKSWCQTVL